jgi:hypothetical protein
MWNIPKRDRRGDRIITTGTKQTTEQKTKPNAKLVLGV